MMAEKAAGSAAVKSHVSIRTMIYLRPRMPMTMMMILMTILMMTIYDIDDQVSIRTMIYILPNYDDGCFSIRTI